MNFESILLAAAFALGTAIAAGLLTVTLYSIYQSPSARDSRIVRAVLTLAQIISVLMCVASFAGAALVLATRLLVTTMEWAAFASALPFWTSLITCAVGVITNVAMFAVFTRFKRLD
jgi:hypothetical protein